MHDEVKTVESSLQRCAERGYCLLDEEMRGSLKEHLSAIVDVLHAKYPQERYPGNNGKFLRAKNMALLLKDILAAKDESELDGYKNNFKENFTALLALYALKEADENYKEALARVLDTFTGQWIGLAGANLVYYNKQLSAAENDTDRANELPGLQEKVEKAISLVNETDEFIRQQPKLNKRW